MPDKAKDLLDIESITLSHYQRNAEAFWLGTKDHDVQQNYWALLSALPVDRPLDILDFGCGPGRDLHYFKSLGHRPIGLDGCPAFCQMARAYSGCEVLQQNFLQLNLDCAAFDGIFANASLFHVLQAELLRVLGELHLALKPQGVLFISTPRGQGEFWAGERYGHYMEIDTCTAYLQQAGFRAMRHYYRPEGKPLKEQPWLAVVAGKV